MSYFDRRTVEPAPQVGVFLFESVVPLAEAIGRVLNRLATVSVRPLCGRACIGVAEVATRGDFTGMRTVGLKALKNKLSEYARLGGGGRDRRRH